MIATRQHIATNGHGMIRRVYDRLARPFSRFGYDAAEDTRRRKSPVAHLQSEDRELAPHKRAKVVTSARDLRRNFAVAAWMIRKHLDYVSTFQFQAGTGIADLDDRIAELMVWKSRKRNLDVAGRHSLRRFIRLAEAHRVVDGDAGILLVEDGRIQGIEGDRIRTPSHWGEDLSRLPPDWHKRLSHGVLLGSHGEAEAYCVCRRGDSANSFQYEQLVPARNLLLHGAYDRFDQVRGIGRVTAALNSFRDLYEGFDAALAKAKVAQIFAMAAYREAEESMGNVEPQTAEDGESSDEPKYKFDPGRGPVFLDLDPGDRLEAIESKQPSSEFQAFCTTILQVCLKSLDIPYSFYSENFTNYSGARQALLQYEQSAAQDREDLREVLDTLTAWWMLIWVLSGTLELPAGFDVRDLRWEWIPTGLPWIDPLKESQAHVLQLRSGLSSRQRICKQAGNDWWEILKEIDEEEKALAEHGLTGLGEMSLTIVNEAERDQRGQARE